MAVMEVKVKVPQSCPTICWTQARILECVAFPFSRGSSQLRDWIQVSCIAGGFFISWVTREACHGNLSNIKNEERYLKHKKRVLNSNTWIVPHSCPWYFPISHSRRYAEINYWGYNLFSWWLVCWTFKNTVIGHLCIFYFKFQVLCNSMYEHYIQWFTCLFMSIPHNIFKNHFFITRLQFR